MKSRQTVMGSDGASAVEFALVVPFLVILVFGITQFGIIFMQDLGVSNAARQGARLGVQPGTTCLDVINNITATDSRVDLTAPGSTDIVMRLLPQDVVACNTGLLKHPCELAQPGDRLRVRVTYRGARLDIPLVMSRQVNMVREGVFRCEASA